MTTMVYMIRDGKPSGEPTGIDDALAKEWERDGVCQIVKDKPTTSATTASKPTKKSEK